MRALLLGLTCFVVQGTALAGDSAKGKEIAEKGASGPPCASCHGLEGAKPIAPNYPILAGQYPDYIERALLDYQSGKRANPIMRGIAGPLKKKEIEDVAAWFSSQQSKLHFQR